MSDSDPQKATQVSSQEPNSSSASSAGRSTLWNLPNQLTIARLILSVIFFVLLSLDLGPATEARRQIILNVAFVVFILAVVTDFLDGYFARRWGLISTFGRIADPFADKIVICGGFVMLISVSPLVQPWLAVVIIFREFLVSGLRSFLESKGVAFGAAFIGKLKMIVQSITIPVLLFYEANLRTPPAVSPSWLPHFFHYATIAFTFSTLILTVASCITYLQRAYRLIRSEKRG